MSQHALQEETIADTKRVQARAAERRDGTHGVRIADTGAGTGVTELQLSALDQALLQFQAAVAERTKGKDPHAIAAQGMAGGGGGLPHLEAIQKSFGRHDVSNVQAYTGTAANCAAEQLGAHAYAANGAVVLGADATDLHTVAHEAAHVVQQRGGVQLKGGLGAVGDRYENHADAVADAVVAGADAEGLLDRYAPASGATAAEGGHNIQRLSRIKLMAWLATARSTIASYEGREDARKAAVDWLEGEGLANFNKPETTAEELNAALDAVLQEADETEIGMVETQRAVHETHLPAGGILTGDLSSLIADPVDLKPVFPGAPETILVRLDGEHDLELRAGQNYLCTETSLDYLEDSGCISTEVFELTRANEAMEEREVYVVGGGHHRLVWMLFHGLKPTVTLNHSMSIAGQPWSMIYKPRPEKLQTKEITDVGSVAESLFRCYVSRTKEATDLRSGDLEEFVQAYCKKKKLDATLCMDGLIGLLSGHLKGAQLGPFPAAVEELTARSLCEGDELAVRYHDVLLESADQLRDTPVILSHAESGGDFDLIWRVVILDPSLSPLQMLECLAFEMQNAKLADELSTASHSAYGSVAEVEFGSDYEFLEVLKKVHRVDSYEELGYALGLEKFLDDATEGQPVVMPTKDALPDETARKALWWYKTRNWGKKAKMAAWANSSHSEGMKTSAEEYSGHKKVEFGL